MAVRPNPVEWALHGTVRRESWRVRLLFLVLLLVDAGVVVALTGATAGAVTIWVAVSLLLLPPLAMLAGGAFQTARLDPILRGFTLEEVLLTRLRHEEVLDGIGVAGDRASRPMGMLWCVVSAAALGGVTALGSGLLAGAVALVAMWLVALYRLFAIRAAWRYGAWMVTHESIWRQLAPASMAGRPPAMALAVQTWIGMVALMLAAAMLVGLCSVALGAAMLMLLGLLWASLFLLVRIEALRAECLECLRLRDDYNPDLAGQDGFWAFLRWMRPRGR
jgi:hypothetical protein